MKKQYILCLTIIPLLASCGGKVNFDELNDVSIHEYSNETSYEEFIDAYNIKVASNLVMAGMLEGKNSFKLSSKFAQFTDRYEYYSEDGKVKGYNSRFKNYDMKFDSENKFLRNEYQGYYQGSESGSSDESFCVNLNSASMQYELLEDGTLDYYEEQAHTVANENPGDYNVVVRSVVRSTFLNDVEVISELEDDSYMYPLSSFNSLNNEKKAEYKFFIDDEYLTIEFNHPIDNDVFKFNEKSIEQYFISENEFDFAFKSEIEYKVTSMFFPKSYTECKIKTVSKSTLSKVDVTIEKMDPTGYIKRN